MRKVLPWVVAAIVAGAGLYWFASALRRDGRQSEPAGSPTSQDQTTPRETASPPAQHDPSAGEARSSIPDADETAGPDARDAFAADDGLITITGRVLTPAGRPVAGADVAGEGLHGWAETDKAGRYEIELELEDDSLEFQGSLGSSFSKGGIPEGAPERVEQFCLVAVHPSYAVTTVGPFPCDRPPREVDITLVEGGRIAGMVCDTTGGPVGGARIGLAAQPADGDATPYEVQVQYSGLHGSLPGSFAMNHLCDAGGCFTTMVLLPGVYVVSADPPYEELRAGEPVTVTVKAGETVQGVRLTLAGGYDVSGCVLDLNEQPVPGALVSTDRDDAMYFCRTAHSIEDGSFTLRAMPAEETTVYVTAETFRTAEVQCEPPETDRVIRLRPAPRIVGRVVDRATQKPVTRFVLGACRDDEYALWEGVFGSEGTLQGFDSPDGEFEIYLQDAGCRMVAVGAEGYAVALVRGIQPVDATEPRPVVVELVHGATVTVSVTSAQDGKPVAGALVHLRSMEFEKELRGDAESWPLLPTGQEGTCVIPNVSPGGHNVTVDNKFRVASDGTAFEIGEQDTAKTVDIVLGSRTGASIVGRVVSAHDTSPLAGATVRLDAGYGGGGFPGEEVPAELPTCRTDANGAFVFDGVPAGIRSLCVEAEGFAPCGETVYTRVDADRQIVVRMRRLAQISGTVSTRDGRPVAGVPVRLNCGDFVPDGPCSAETDAAGRYTMSDVASGCNTVTVGEGASVQSRNVLVAPGQVARLDFVFGMAGIYGVVTRAGEPVPRSCVLVAPRSCGLRTADAPKAWCETDAEGRYRLEGLLPGEYSVSAVSGYDSEDGQPTTTYVDRDVTVAGADVQLDIELEPDEPTGAVRGIVVLHNGWPGENARVWLVPATLSGSRPEQLARAYSQKIANGLCDEDGAFCIEGVEPGRYTLVVSRIGYALSTTPIEKLDGRALEGLRIALQPEASVLAEVRFADEAAGWQPEKVSVRIYDASGAMLSLKQTDYVPNDGRFRISGLGPGTCVLVAEIESFAPCRREIAVVPDGQAQVLFEFEWGQRISVVVRDAAGKPVPFATVVLDVGGDPFAAAHALGTHKPADTDERGNVRFYSLADGDYTVHVQCDGYADAAVPAAIAGQDEEVAVTLVKRGD